MNNIVAPNIKRIISKKGIKQLAIAEKAGYTKKQFSDMMNGRKLIKDVDIHKIAYALGVRVDELFEIGGD